MFNLIMKRRGSVGNIFKRPVVKRQINNSGSLRTFTRMDEISVNNLKIQYCVKHLRINYINNRNYSTSPEPIKDGEPQTSSVNIKHSFARSILESKEIYSGNLAKNLPVYDDEITESEIDNYINESWESSPTPQIVEAFKRISFYVSINDESIVLEKYNKFIKYLITKCKQFTDSEIHVVLSAMSLWPDYHTGQDPIHKSFRLALNTECIRRAPQWTIDELLLVCDHWYKVEPFRWKNFLSYVIKKIGNEPSQMSASNLVQFMFYIAFTGNYPRKWDNLESKTRFCVDELDIDELSIVAMGLYNSPPRTRNSILVAQIIYNVIKDIDTIHNIALLVIFKFIRYSHLKGIKNVILDELLNSIVPQIPRLWLTVLALIAATTVKMRVVHPELLTSIARRFNDEIKDARLMDMDHLVLALAWFNFTPDIPLNIYETIVEELRSPDTRKDLARHQIPLAKLLNHLSVVNIYPHDLISLVLDPKNLEKTYRASLHNVDPVILSVDLNVDVEVPDYIGPRLDNRQRTASVRKQFTKLLESNETDSSEQHNFRLQIMDSCKEIFGSTEMFHSDWILPQYPGVDVIFCLDENNFPLPVAQSISEISFGNPKRIPEIYPEGCRWFALIFGTKGSYVRNSRQLLGYVSAKIRQLEKLGYKPIVISYDDWDKFGRNKKNYLRDILCKIIGSLPSAVPSQEEVVSISSKSPSLDPYDSGFDILAHTSLGNSEAAYNLIAPRPTNRSSLLTGNASSPSRFAVDHNQRSIIDPIENLTNKNSEGIPIRDTSGERRRLQDDPIKRDSAALSSQLEYTIGDVTKLITAEKENNDSSLLVLGEGLKRVPKIHRMACLVELLQVIQKYESKNNQRYKKRDR